MLFLISLSIALFVAFFLDKPLKKHPTAFYLTAAVLTAVSIIVLQSDVIISSRFVRDYVIGIFSRGALGCAFWAVVMWAGALPNGSAPIKKLMPIRGELSITAAIITLSHIITYGLQYISNFLKNRTGSDFVTTSVVCIIMVLIMTPLTIMSFKSIRKKMNPKTWKNIQRFAYIFYALIYIHIMVLFIPKAKKGSEDSFISVIIYSLVFIGYAVMRIRKYYIAKKKPEHKAALNIICIFTGSLLLAASAVVSYGKDKSNNKKFDSVKEPVTFTFTTTATAVTSSITTVSTSASTTVTIKNTETTTSASYSTETTAKTTDSIEKTTSKSEQITEEQHENETEQQQNDDENIEEQTEQSEPEPETEPQITYKYKNGEYEGESDGYAGKVHVKLTIENDTITSFSAWADDDDPEYFGDAMNTVIPQIASKVSTDGVDACSGATYSSKGIIEAANNALEKALSE